MRKVRVTDDATFQAWLQTVLANQSDVEKIGMEGGAFVLSFTGGYEGKIGTNMSFDDEEEEEEEDEEDLEVEFSGKQEDLDEFGQPIPYGMETESDIDEEEYEVLFEFLNEEEADALSGSGEVEELT